jgi:predicted  nucleic acid-binding Zn-ribbon protein
LHVDLCVIRDLLAVDVEQDALRVEAGELAGAVRSAKDIVAKTQAGLAQAEASLAAAVTDERTLNRRLADYTAKRDRTRRLIDAGEAPDYQTAVKQYEQCASIVDDLETALLEAMDAHEAADEVVAGARLRVAQAEAAYRSATEAQATRRPAVASRYKELSPVRAERAQALNPSQAHHYAILRKRETPILVYIVNGTCSHCHVAPPAQMMVEVGSDRRVHTCRNCSSWFKGILHPEMPDDAD